MHIALIHFRLVRNGGLETRLFNYIATFRQLGHTVSLVVSKVDNGIELPPDVQVHQINLKRVPKPLRMWAFDRALRPYQQGKSFDLMFSLGRTSHQDLVLCPGNHLGYLNALNVRWPSPIDWLNVHLDKLAFARSKRILAASGMMRNELINLYRIPPEKISVLWPPININAFKALSVDERAELKQLWNIEPNAPVVSFFTTGNERKGYPLVIEMAKHLPDNVAVVVAGVKNTSALLPPNVRFVGYLDHTAPLHQLADVMVAPDLYEPFGQVVAESLLCGTPVVISDRVGASDILTPNTGEVLNSRSPKTWASTVQKWLEKETRAELPESLIDQLDVVNHCRTILSLAQ